MNINYYLRDNTQVKTSVYAVVRFRGHRYKLSAGVSVEVEYWTGSRVEEKKSYPEADVINIKLDRFESRIKKAFEHYIISKQIPSKEIIKEAAADKPIQEPKVNNEFMSFFHNYYNNASYEQSTWKKYNTTYNWLTKYQEQTKHILSFDNINMDFYSSFRIFVLSKKYKPKKGENARFYTSNYFGSLIKCIKKVMNEAGLYGARLHSNTEFKSKKFKTESETADSIYLSVDELKKINQFTATPENIKKITNDQRMENLNRKASAMNLSKNKFLIGAFTALRVSDFNRLDEVNIKQNWITIKPKKGIKKNADVVIPIHPIIRDIIDSGFQLSTKVSDQKINKHIKEVCKLVGINEQVSVTRTEGEKLTERTYKKYQLVTTHTARRSGATNMYLAGIPPISIMKITGHTTERSFMKYIKIDHEQNAMLLQNHPFFK